MKDIFRKPSQLIRLIVMIAERRFVKNKKNLTAKTRKIKATIEKMN